MAEENSIRVGFGLRLKAARERRQLTQQQVADVFSVKKGTVSAWEMGGGVPDSLRLRRLAKLYGVSADALLWDDSLTPEAMQFAAQFDALSDRQQRAFRAMWLAYFEQAKEDTTVEENYGLPPGRSIAPPPIPDPGDMRADIAVIRPPSKR